LLRFLGMRIVVSFHPPAFCLTRTPHRLDPEKGSRGGGLQVREHPTTGWSSLFARRKLHYSHPLTTMTGPYCEDLSVVPVASFSDVESLMRTGNSARTVAATKMNMMSSRSHAIFTLTFTQSIVDRSLDVKTDKISKIHLVWLHFVHRPTPIHFSIQG
jgi:hypothetical protein